MRDSTDVNSYSQFTSGVVDFTPNSQLLLLLLLLVVVVVVVVDGRVWPMCKVVFLHVFDSALQSISSGRRCTIIFIIAYGPLSCYAIGL